MTFETLREPHGRTQLHLVTDDVVAVGPGQVLLRNRAPGGRRIRKPGVRAAFPLTAALPGRVRSGCRGAKSVVLRTGPRPLLAARGPVQGSEFGGDEE